LGSTKLDRSNWAKVQFGTGAPTVNTKGNIYVNNANKYLYVREYGTGTWTEPESNLWDRTVTVLSPQNAGDTLTIDSITTGAIIGGSPLSITSDGEIDLIMTADSGSTEGITISASNAGLGRGNLDIEAENYLSLNSGEHILFDTPELILPEHPGTQGEADDISVWMPGTGSYRYAGLTDLGLENFIGMAVNVGGAGAIGHASLDYDYYIANEVQFSVLADIGEPSVAIISLGATESDLIGSYNFLAYSSVTDLENYGSIQCYLVFDDDSGEGSFKGEGRIEIAIPIHSEESVETIAKFGSSVIFTPIGGIQGSHTGASNVAILADSNADFTTNELIGRTIYNTSDNSYGVITANTTNTVTATLSGGTDDDWDFANGYHITSGFDVRTESILLNAIDNSNLTITANATGDKTLTISATNDGAGDGLIAIDAAAISSDSPWTITAADSSDQIPLSIVQSDVTSDPRPAALSITSDPNIGVVPSTGGSIHLTSPNTGTNVIGCIDENIYIGSTNTSADPKTSTFGAVATSTGKATAAFSALSVLATAADVEVNILAGVTGAGGGDADVIINATTNGAGTASLDIDADDAITIDSAAISIDSTDDSNLTMTANDAGDKTLSIAASNAGAGAGILTHEADGDITFDALGAAAATPFNEAGQTDLDGTFTATSIVGTINELHTQIVTDFVTIEWAEDGAVPPAAAEQYVGGANGKVRLRRFDDAVVEDVVFLWNVPDDIDAASGIKFKVKGIITDVAPGAVGVSFKLSGYSSGSGDDIDGAFGAEGEANITDLDAVGVDAIDDQFITAYSGTVTVTNLAAGETAMLHFERDTADGDDTYAQDIGVLGIVIQYTRIVTGA